MKYCVKSARERPRILVSLVVIIQTLQKDRLQNAVYDVIAVPKCGKQNIIFLQICRWYYISQVGSLVWP